MWYPRLNTATRIERLILKNQKVIMPLDILNRFYNLPGHSIFEYVSREKSSANENS